MAVDGYASELGRGPASYGVLRVVAVPRGDGRKVAVLPRDERGRGYRLSLNLWLSRARRSCSES